MPERPVNKSKEFYNNAPELTPLTGGKPAKGWNAIMMRGKGGRPEAYSSGKQIYPNAGATKDWPVRVSAGRIVKAALELIPEVAVKNAQTKLAADSLFEDMKLKSQCLKLAAQTPATQPQQPQPIQMPATVQPQKANIQSFVGQLVNNFKQRLKPVPPTPQSPVKQAQLGEGKKDSEFNSKQLEMGKDIETEHTDDKTEAKAIAKDHLAEIPDYYTRLDEMEKEAEKEGKKQAAEQEIETRVIEIVKKFDDKSNWSEYLKTANLDVSDAELAHALRLALIKTGDIAQYMPRSEYLMVTPDGKVVTKKLPSRRYTFPTEGSGTPALYEPNLKFIPEAGIPTSGYHGYDIGFNVGDTDKVPEGYDALPALDVLKDLYGSMGIAANRPYQNLDRARARVLLRYLKRRAKNKVS